MSLLCAEIKVEAELFNLHVGLYVGGAAFNQDVSKLFGNQWWA